MPRNDNSSPRLRSEEGKRLRVVGPSTARGRFRVILPLLRFRARRAVGEGTRVLLPSGKEILGFTELARYRARQFHVSERQVFRWLDRFDHGGYAALARRPRSDRGVSNFFSNRPLVVAFITTRYLDGWHVATIHEALRQGWGLLCRDGSPLPSPTTLRKFLDSMVPESVLTRVLRHG